MDWIIENSAHSAEQGARFERLMLRFFKEEPTWSAQFDEVWLWDDWPDRDGPDHGIDLVAKNAGEDTFTAIQAKCYAAGTPVKKNEINTFITASDRAHFTRRVFVSTGHRLSSNAEKELADATPPAARVGVAELENTGIDWSLWSPESDSLQRKRPNEPMPHQDAAVASVVDAFEDGDDAVDRGQLIMACGTGKTFTAQVAAEKLVGATGLVLVLAPSISLISQTITSWYSNRTIPFTAFSICSDPRATGDTSDLSPYDLVVPASTDPETLVRNVGRAGNGLRVVFSTYQSLPQIMAAQKEYGLNDFDLVICDEAHRTTGTSDSAETPTGFRLIHNDAYVRARLRLYMTATPRIYSESVASKAVESGHWVASMDDKAVFGEVLYSIGFREAVNLGLLVDYKVLTFGVETTELDALFTQGAMDDAKVPAEEAAKWVGCLNAIAKRERADGHVRAFAPGDDVPLQRAIAFTSRVKKSKQVESGLPYVAEKFQTLTGVDGEILKMEVRHVDGTQSASTRTEALAWLGEQPGKQVCRILSNAQCLTEGIDVPALDAIIMLEPRQSVIDIVQAVGRVMRSHKDPETGKEKEFGYIIIPVPVLPGQSVEDKLNSRGFETFHQVISALRAHDPDLSHEINILRFAGDVEGDTGDDRNPLDDKIIIQGTLEFATGLAELKEKCWAEMVRRVGDIHYLSRWTDTVVDTAASLEHRIELLIERRGMKSRFKDFVKGLRSNLNDGVSERDAVALLAQHLITEPVFDAMFPGYLIASSNPVAASMRTMLDALTGKGLEAETEELEGFYQTVRDYVRGLESNPQARQKILIKLYEEFFQKAFPKQASALGIVYTPTEITDFIIHAANDALRIHFDGASLTDEGVHILDPFTGTGTFIVQMLQSGLIKPHDMARKFVNELHANEVQLLAYYIATVNIETAYHAMTSGDPEKAVQAFPGIVYTDTFQLGEDDGRLAGTFPGNHARVTHQQGLDVRVIVGNPPYSAGQDSENESNQNLSYPLLDEEIEKSYASRSTASNKRQLYDSYVRAFRWATRQISKHEGGGVIAFVSNGGYVDNRQFDGFRKTLAEEFDAIYVYNLRGDQYTTGEISKAEGGKVFDSGSRAPVAISILVRLPGKSTRRDATIYYSDIGSYKNRVEKLDIVREHGSGRSPLTTLQWEDVDVNEQGDWINPRSEDFGELAPLTDDDGDNPIFELRSLGLATGRDQWNFHSSRQELVANTERSVAHYNDRLEAFHKKHPALTGKVIERAAVVRTFLDESMDPRTFKWTANDFTRLAQREPYHVDADSFVRSTYRPFFKQWLNFNRRLNARTYQLPRIFPDSHSQNLAICIPTAVTKSAFGTLIVDSVPALHLWPEGTLVFPQYRYHEPETGSLFEDTKPQKTHNVTDATLASWRDQLDKAITKDDIFFYIYGLFHAPSYREQYATDLAKQVARVVLPADITHFEAFSQAGRTLADLHLTYETADIWPDLTMTAPTPKDIVKAKWAKTRNDAGDLERDPTRIVLTDKVTLEGIPAAASDYKIGSRSALDWAIDRYQTRTPGDSAIVNDPNRWGQEADDLTYVADMFGRLVTVSMQTLDIVADLPEIVVHSQPRPAPATTVEYDKRFEELTASIESLRSLSDDWFDGNSIRPAGDALQLATEIVRLVRTERLPSPVAFPTPEGGVSLEWFEEAFQMGATIKPKGSGELSYWNSETDADDFTEAPAITPEQVVAYLSQLLGDDNDG